MDYKFDNTVLPFEVIKSAGLQDSDIEECCKISNYYIIKLKGGIGKQKISAIKIASCISWNNGYFLAGYDTEKNDFFQILY